MSLAEIRRPDPWDHRKDLVLRLQPWQNRRIRLIRNPSPDLGSRLRLVRRVEKKQDEAETTAIWESEKYTVPVHQEDVMTRFALLISTILMLPLATQERNLLHRCHCLVGILTNLLHGC